MSRALFPFFLVVLAACATSRTASALVTCASMDDCRAHPEACVAELEPTCPACAGMEARCHPKPAPPP